MTNANEHDVGRAFWRTVTHFDSTKVNPHQAFRNAVGVALPLIVGFAAGKPHAGLAVSLGALYVSYSDGSDPYYFRAKRMLAAGFWCALAAFLGAILGGNVATAIIVSTLWAFAAGLVSSLGTVAANLGMISLVSLVIFAAQYLSPREAALAGLLTLAGGILQTLLSIALWPVQRYGPERRVLSAFYRDLSRIAETPLHSRAAPPASQLGNQAQEAIARLGSERSLESLRYVALLNQAERMRLSLLALTRFRLRISRDNPLHVGLPILDRYLEVAGKALDSLGDALLSDDLPADVDLRFSELESATRQLREVAANAPSSFAEATAHEARFLMDALSGQLRATMDVVSRTVSAGEISAARAEARQPVWLRYTGSLAVLRANLNFESAAFRHALRLSICVALGEIVARSTGLGRSYWLVMTIVLVLKPDFSSTFSRGFLRVGGTLAGLVLATLMFHLHPSSESLLIALVFVLTFILRWVGPANYGIFTVNISALVVLFFAIIGVSPKQVIVTRGINTVAGGAIALLTYWLWPTWERTHISETMSRLLESYRDYFNAVTDANFHPQTADLARLDRTRLQSRRARSNLEASIDRLLAEPGTAGRHVTILNAILANSHRFAHATMALDAYRSRISATPGRPTFLVFAADVEKALTFLAARLRGTHIPSSDWPDLREDCNRLMESGDSRTERYALTNIEADRITNSLNTLRDEVIAWTSSAERPDARASRSSAMQKPFSGCEQIIHKA